VPAPSSDALIVTGEKLIAEPPKDWQNIYSLNGSATRLTDFIPADENKDAWSTKVSFEAHQSLSDTDPITIVMGELERIGETCELVESFNLFSGMENNYPTSVRLTFCGENAHSNRGEISFTKSIQGNDYLYIIKLLHLVDPFTDKDASVSEVQIAQWAQYFSSISVCDDTVAKHACPSPTAE
jgi:hypothetical protein